MKKLKYQGYTIAFQEVPGEVSLIFNVSGCPYHCAGCHSQNLWEYKGRYLTNDFDDVVSQYCDYITAVCFMGGEQNPKEFVLLTHRAHQYGLKTCLYTGADSFSDIPPDAELDYLKLGHYDKQLGGIDSPMTNQRFYQLGELGWFDRSDLFHEVGCVKSENHD